MTRDEFSEALVALGLKQAEFGRRLGVHANTVSAWATGAVGVPAYVGEYLRVLGLAREILSDD
jgi:DNA-binding transcriptional regulator YiaG